jgi:hypothetical protein
MKRTPKRWRIYISACIFILSGVRENGFTMDEYKKNDSRQMRPGLWAAVNERYPGSMITKTDFVPLAKLKKPLAESRLTFVSTSGVQRKELCRSTRLTRSAITLSALCLRIQSRQIWKFIN